MQKGELLYEGKAKKVYLTDNPDEVIVDYKDDATAFNGKKKGTIVGKGEINNRMTNYMFSLLEKEGVKTHLVKELSPRETLVKRVSIVPIEVVMRNIIAGSLSKRIGRAEGERLAKPVLEFYYKDDALDDPMINADLAEAINLATREQIQTIESMARKVNAFMIEFFKTKNIDLVDFKLEFGLFKGEIVLADEISPDTCRFWDSATHEKLDKDRFRRDMGGAEGAYIEIAKRLGL